MFLLFYIYNNLSLLIGKRPLEDFDDDKEQPPPHIEVHSGEEGQVGDEYDKFEDHVVCVDD